MHQNKKYKYQFSNRKIYHSIPIGCILALLLLSITLISPVIDDKPEVSAAPSPDTEYITVDPVASMSIVSPTDNSITNSSADAEAGVTSYISNLVKISIRGLNGYTLQLTAADGASTTLVNGGTTINGATGQTGSSLNSNTWGYGWDAENAAEGSMKYYALPAYGAASTDSTNGLLESHTYATSSGLQTEVRSIELSKKLTFAAKFDGGAEAGHYKTSALLSLVMSPQTNVAIDGFSGIAKMQDMTSNICNNASQNTVGALLDTRDNRIYSVVKLKDGNCWMRGNLQLSNATISSYDSDMRESDGDFTVPASNISGFTSNDQYGPKTYVDAIYGGYYNWYTATAGTGDANLTSGNAPSSICPKGWQLPVNGNAYLDKSYSKLLSGLSASAITAAPYNFIYSGFINDGNLTSATTNGYYWSATAVDGDLANNLGISTSGTSPAGQYYRYSGQAVRCVAK